MLPFASLGVWISNPVALADHECDILEAFIKNKMRKPKNICTGGSSNHAVVEK